MKRKMVKIDEDICNGCGDCIPNCHEGALQVIDGKARLISDLFCDGLGACLGHCPVGAITIEEREAVPYDETAVLKEMVPKGENTVSLHLKHLQEHNETTFYNQGIEYLRSVKDALPFNLNNIEKKLNKEEQSMEHENGMCGCPGSAARAIERNNLTVVAVPTAEQQSELSQWPIQMHLINPAASYFQNADLLIAADCVAFAMGNFHSAFLKGRKVVIACPKLDSSKETYIQKFVALVNQAKINTLTVMMMEVPCCGGLLQLVQEAIQQAARKVPVKAIYVSIKGEVLQEEWV
jgi:ferredoxin